MTSNVFHSKKRILYSTVSYMNNQEKKKINLKLLYLIDRSYFLLSFSAVQVPALQKNTSWISQEEEEEERGEMEPM